MKLLIITKFHLWRWLFAYLYEKYQKLLILRDIIGAVDLLILQKYHAISEWSQVIAELAVEGCTFLQKLKQYLNSIEDNEG